MEKYRTDTLTISPKYQVVIPRAIRKQLGLQPGQKIRVLAYGRHFSLVPVRPIKSMRGFLKELGTRIERED